jgi:hypothetical protein|nr:MAG TPA: protein of unknown function DUF2828 [Caudoviricetes sp.]
MDFMKLIEKNEKSVTENGAIGFNTTGSTLVDLNFRIPSFREGIDNELFDKALYEDNSLILKWLLYLRDIREGVGERKSFRDFFVYLCDKHIDLANEFIYYVPIEEYGRWDDIVDVAYRVQNTYIKSHLIEKITRQLNKDIENMKQEKNVSLIAKWLPSQNTSSKKTKEKARFLCKELNMSEKQYRKMLSELRAYIDVVERKMSANKWADIDYSSVPSKANVNYRYAFENHDGERRAQYLESLKKGETKINANAMFLHDIVHAYSDSITWLTKHREYNETLEQLWKAQDKCEGFKDTVVVRDGSGSMTCEVSSRLTALEVADAITLYCAENNEGAFKNKFITFGSYAKLIDVSHLDNLCDKLDYLSKYTDCTSTNIEGVFDLILDTAVKNNITQEDMPKTVLIASDLEFNEAQGYYYTANNNKALFETIAEKYKNSGYKLPKLVFWNIKSRTNTVPITQNENGVILISGFSKNLMDMVLSNEIDPYKSLVKQLNTPRYEVVDKIFAKNY